MATSQLPTDFKDFLRLLNSKHVEYLLVGGYAVAYHGYPRATADMDVWIAVHSRNAGKMTEVIREFGFDVQGLSEELFLKPNNVIRLGVPPLRIEVMTTISGVEFEACYRDRATGTFDDIEVNIISLRHLKTNKKAAGRLKDLSDLDYLP